MTWRSVLVFIGRRLAASALLLVLASFLVFSLLYLAPGSPLDILLGTDSRNPETVRLLTQQYHLDEPFLVQYWIWAKAAVQLDFGKSIQTTLPVVDQIKTRLPTSLLLACYAFVVTMVAGVGLGVATALRQRTFIDRGIVAVTIIGLSMPAFVSGVLLLYLFGVVVPVFPAFGGGVGVIDRIWHLTLPALALSFVLTAYVVRHTRAAMTNVLDQDYVTFARARGLSRRRILFSYTLRNALIPIVTVSALVLSALIQGSVLIEVTFSLSGIGSLLVQSAEGKDLPTLQALTLFIAIFVMTANLIADLAYMAVDPRIRLGRSR